jgi:hypothetical protein
MGAPDVDGARGAIPFHIDTNMPTSAQADVSADTF